MSSGAADYAEWVQTSPDWASLRLKVFIRAKGRCEACGNARATCVHHLSYRWGKLPPLWALSAVCSSCHGRLHDPDDEWCLPGMGCRVCAAHQPDAGSVTPAKRGTRRSHHPRYGSHEGPHEDACQITASLHIPGQKTRPWLLLQPLPLNVCGTHYQDAAP